MRKVAFSLAAAVSALAAAAPASAQWAPPPPPPGYGAPYGNAYGYDNRGQANSLLARVQQLRNQIRVFDQRGRLSTREARRLDRHAVELLRRIQAASYRGLNRRERQDIERRIEGLRHAIRYEARDGNNRWGWNGHNANDNGFGYYGERRRDGDRRWDRDDDRDDNRGERRRDRDDD